MKNGGSDVRNGRDGRPSAAAQGVSRQSGAQTGPINANQRGDGVLATLPFCVEPGSVPMKVNEG
jgi:hypothetical protein